MIVHICDKCKKAKGAQEIGTVAQTPVRWKIVHLSISFGQSQATYEFCPACVLDLKLPERHDESQAEKLLELLKDIIYDAAADAVVNNAE